MMTSGRQAPGRTEPRVPMLAASNQRISGRVSVSGAIGSFQPVSDVLALAVTVSVIIPTLNEARNLPHVFEALPDWIAEVVLVDGRSTDDTVAVARRLRPDVRVVMQEGRGKGDALLAGFAASTGDIIVALDADGSTDAGEIVRFVTALIAGADFVKGSRFASGGGSADLTRTRRLGNKFLGALVNQLFGTRYTDLCYGYNALWARHLDTLALDCAGFEVETLMNIRAATAGLVVHEVPSFEHRRIHGVSNLRIVMDGRRIAKVIVREWFAHRRAKRVKVEVPSAGEVSASDLSFSELRVR
jgi:glycosyltransferase involved in cell wall biosynthesis